MGNIFDAKRELAAFYERHFEELVDACLETSARVYRWSPLNTLSYEERRRWVSVGFKEIMRSMTGEEIAGEGRVYYPRVSELGDTPFFGIADIIDSCECALLPDDGILPLLWNDYQNDPDKLLALVAEFRKAQNNMTKAHVRQQMADFERYIEFVKKMAVTEEWVALEEGIYQRFYLALRSLRDKTGDLYDLVGSGADPERLLTEVTQLKMMEADLLAEVFRVDPEMDFERREMQKPSARNRFCEAAESAGLTEREREVTALVARGYSNKDISVRMSLAESTVKNYLSSILSKLGKENRSQIVVFAAENGYFEDVSDASL